MPTLSFDDYINESTRNFVGREWVFSAINDWLTEQHGARIFLLEGEPGCGKTALVSRLVQFSQGKATAPSNLQHLSRHFLSAFHFCSSRDRRWLSPAYLVHTLIESLKERNEAYTEALIENGWGRELHMTANQNVLIGSPTAFNINTFYAHGLPTEDLFSRYILEPLEMLSNEGVLRPTVILIDALDESLAFGDTYTIVSVLRRIEELPPEVRFILTSRHDVRVKEALSHVEGVKEYSFSAANFDPFNREDIGKYVRERFKEPVLAEQLTLSEPALATEVTGIITRKAEGNFLYVRFLLDAVASGYCSLTELEGLPEGLEELYYESLERVVNIGKRDWTTVYAPLIKILAASQESPTFTHLWAFTEQAGHIAEKSELKEYLRDLQQFIEEVQSQGDDGPEKRYRLYHQSFVDFLHREEIVLKKRQRENRFYFSVEEAHKLMAERCGQGGLAEIWTNQRDSIKQRRYGKRSHAEQERRSYALKYYITHLYYAGEQVWPQLFDILTVGKYGQEKMRSCDPSARAYVQDLDLGRQAVVRFVRDNAEDMGEALLSLPQLWHYTLLRCSLSSRADQYPPEAFRLLMLLKHKQEEIVGRAELISRPLAKVDAFLQIASLTTDETNRLKLMKHVCETIHLISGQGEQDIALWSLGEALAQFEQQEQIQQVIEAIKDPQKRDRVRCALGDRLAQAQQWDYAEKIIYAIEYRKWHDRAMYTLGHALALCQHWERAQAVFLSIKERYWRIRGLCELGELLTEAQREDQALQVWAKIEEISATAMPMAQVKSWGQLGETLTRISQQERAQQAWNRAKRSLRLIKEKGRQTIALCELLIHKQDWEQLAKAVNSISFKSRDVRNQAQNMQRKALIKAQQWERFKGIIDAIKKSWFKDRLRRELIEALAQTQQWEQLQEIIDAVQMENPLLYMDALYIQAVALSHAGQWKEAQNVIESIEDDTLYNGALYILTGELAQAQQWEQAQNIIDMIEEREWQIKAFCKLGVELAQNGNEKDAQAIWEKVETLIGTLQERHAQNRAVYKLQQVMTAGKEVQKSALADHQQNGSKPASLETEPIEVLLHRQQLERIITDLPSSDIKARILQELGVALSLGYYWKQAKEIIDSIQDSEKRVETLLEQGKLLAQAGLVAQAQDIWREAQTILLTLSDEIMRSKLCGELTESLVAVQQWEQAQEVIALMTDKENRVRALGKVGVASLQAQQRDQAEEAWTEALLIIGDIETRDEKDQALCAVARALAEAQQWKRAELVLKSIQKKRFKATALSKLGEALMLAQEKERAEQVWQQTEQMITTMQVGGERDVALRALSSALLHTQRWEDAERVIAAIQGSTLRVRSLAELGYALLQAQQWERAEKVWLDAEEITDIISANSEGRVRALIELAGGLARAQRWESAEQIWMEIKEALTTNQEEEAEHIEVDQPGSTEYEGGEVYIEAGQPGQIAVKAKRRRGKRGGRPSLTKLVGQAQELGINPDEVRARASIQGTNLRELLKKEIASMQEAKSRENSQENQQEILE